MAAQIIHTSAVPPVICGARVIEYAVVDDTVNYTGREHLYVGGKELGPVPCLAICQNLDDDFMYLAHCDKHWNVLGASGSGTEPETLANLKESAEKAYRGISNKWQPLSISKEDAIRFEALLDEGRVCGFCNQIFDDDEKLFHGAYGAICHNCVANLRDELSEK